MNAVMKQSTECAGYSWQQSWKLLRPVMLNMLLTLTIWVGVYGAKNDGIFGGFALLQSGSENTTGNDLMDGLLNGVGCICIIGLVSFVILALAMFDMKRLVQFWIGGSCVAVLFGVFGMFASDVVTNLLGCGPSLSLAYLSAGFVTGLYGSVGCMVFFTNRAPLWLHQFYVICNCSLVSVYYLRTFPVHTAWFVLFFIIAWDWFAVLTPYGPLNLVQEKAGDYSQDILKFLMFSAESESTDHEEDQPIQEEEYCECVCEAEKEENSEGDVRTAEQISQTEVHQTDDDPEEEPERTAFDAFSDDRVRLGMGDFVFYGVLVGKAACSGSILATFAAFVGICVGLLLTLMVVFKRDDTVPALPNSIALGILLHFSTLYGIEPAFNCVMDYVVELLN